MQYKCEFCHDTGSLNPDADLLDCGHCDTTTDRIALNKWLAEQYKQGTVGAVYEMDAWRIHQRALAMAPKQEAKEGSNKELRTLKEAAKRAGMANHFIDGKLRDDMFVIGKDFIERLHAELEKLCPPIAAPAAANGAPGYAEKASPIAITDSSALNGIKWYVPPPEHLRNGMQLYFVAPQPIAAAGPDAALIEDAMRYRHLRDDECEVRAVQMIHAEGRLRFESYAGTLDRLIDEARVALSGAKGN